MNKLPSISSYGDYDSNNYGVNSLQVEFEEFTLYYSYKTIVAYYDYQDGLVVCKNVWGTTTGKHLNWINKNHEKRLDESVFNAKLEAMLARHVS